MEGLEISEIYLHDLNVDLRYEAEYFRKKFLRETDALHKYRVKPLGELANVTDGPHGYHEVDDASPIAMLTAKCAKDWEATRSGADTISRETHENNLRSSLVPDDLILSTRGTVGLCAIVGADISPANIDQDLARISLNRPNHVYSNFLCAYLNSKFGQDHLERESSGMVQQGIPLTKVRAIPIPQLSERAIEAISKAVANALRKSAESRRGLENAWECLSRKLKLLPEKHQFVSTYTTTFGKTYEQNRLDSEFYHPRVDELYKRLGDRKQFLSDVVSLRKERFSPGTSKFNYLEIGAVSTDGTVQDSIIDGVDAPSRATWIVHKNDIVTSTVRPIRSLSAMIDEHQENAVASSGFAVLQPTHISPELLLCYLKLPQICELMDLHTSASMYPAISVSDILNLPFKHPGKEAEDEIISLVQQARAKRRQSKSLLERAKRAVEIAIEHDEATALAYLDGKHYVAEELLPKLFHLNRHYVDLDAIQRTIEAESIHYEPTTISRYLLDWQAESRLFDAGRGWYSDLPHRYVHAAEIDIVNSVFDVIQENFPMLDHSIWSTRELTKFFHHLPTRHATFLMVDRDAFESVAEVLQDAGLNVIVHPLGEVAKKFKLVAADTVIIRPRLASDHHEIRSPIEQILVDLHYECQKLGLYDGQEVSRIVNNLGTAYRINIAALSRYAQRRKIDPQDILSSIL